MESEHAGYVNENPVNLLLWRGDGNESVSGTAPRGGVAGREDKFASMSLGRSDSERSLGVIVKRGDWSQACGFVLSPVQVKALRDYLDEQLPRLKTD
jgi:hypothetical protein